MKKKVIVAKYDGRCARCTQKTTKGEMLEPVEVPGQGYVKWCHLGCEFQPGYVMGQDGKAVPSEEFSAPEISNGTVEGAAGAEDAVSDVSHGATQSLVSDGAESDDGEKDALAASGDEAGEAEAEGSAQSDAAEGAEGEEGEGDGEGEGQGEGQSSQMPQPQMDELLDLIRKLIAEKFGEEMPKQAANLMEILSSFVEQNVKANIENTEEAIIAKISALEKSMKKLIDKKISVIQPKVIKVEKPDGKTFEIEGEILHEKLEEVLDLVTTEPRENVLLVGPSGCGKTHLHQQLAKVLDLRAGMISCSAMTSESQLLGRSVPNLSTGESAYEAAPFSDFFENGGVWLFDESDAADANALLVINAATSNGAMALPARKDAPMAKKHTDFICICAANTFGTGADRMYVGRNQQDAAWLDRFNIGTVEMDYDARIEQMVCPDEKLYQTFLTWRSRIREHSLRRLMSTRFMKSAYKMHSQKGWSLKDIGDRFFAGWTADEVRKVKG